MEKNTDKIPIWLDCDPGHDDAMAIIMAACNPKIHLLGISTVFGNAKVEFCTNNALRVLSVCGLGDIDVVEGADGPICPYDELEHSMRSEEIHGEDGLGTRGDIKVPNTTKKPLEKNCILHMYETIIKQSKKVKVVATGCFTNVALLIKAFPEVKKNIDEIVIMGGAINFGNVTPAAEANIIKDSEAAHIICNSGLKVVMVPLEVTHTALSTKEVLDKILSWNTDFSKMIVGILEFFRDTYRDVFGFDSPPVHDPCCIAYCLNPEIFEIKKTKVVIERFGIHSRGRTLCDMHGLEKGEKNVDLALKMDVDKFWELMLDALKVANDQNKL